MLPSLICPWVVGRAAIEDVPVPHSNVAWPNNVDILDDFAESKKRPKYPRGRRRDRSGVEDRSSGFVGDVVRWNVEAVTLRDRGQQPRFFTWKPGGFLVDGSPVTLVRPATQNASATQRITASGSVAGDGAAKIARASRIWVEGTHDAELHRACLGRRLARPRHRGRTAPRSRRSGSSGTRIRARRPMSSRRPTRSSRRRLEGDAHRCGGARPLRAHHRPSVRRRVGGHSAQGGRARTRGPMCPEANPGKRASAERSVCPFEGFWPRLRNQVKYVRRPRARTRRRGRTTHRLRRRSLILHFNPVVNPHTAGSEPPVVSNPLEAALDPVRRRRWRRPG